MGAIVAVAEAADITCVNCRGDARAAGAVDRADDGGPDDRHEQQARGDAEPKSGHRPTLPARCAQAHLGR